MSDPTPHADLVSITLDRDTVKFIAENVGLSGPEFDGWAAYVGEACRSALAAVPVEELHICVEGQAVIGGRVVRLQPLGRTDEDEVVEYGTDDCPLEGADTA